MSERSDKQLKKIRDIYVEIIQKLFIRNKEGGAKSIYKNKVDRVGKKKFSLRGHNFVHAALFELKSHFQQIKLNPMGKILNAGQIGKHFGVLYRVISDNVDLYAVYDNSQIDSADLPLSSSFKTEFRKIIDYDEAAAILLVKHPPEEISREIHKITEQSLHGLMTLWSDERFQRTSEIRRGLKDYLHHATVIILNTGQNPEVDKITTRLNEHLEKHGGFEDRHWLRVVKGVAQDEKKESLKQALSVCVPIIVVIKIAEKILPGILHAIGGVLDDLFGAIIPDVSQSMGERSLPSKERLKKSWPILKGGLMTIPIAFALGYFSAVLYGKTQSTALHMAAGVLFAFACFLGTLGTSLAAFKKAYSFIEELQKDKEHGYLVANLTGFEKAKLAFKESIIDVPFRVGHTVIGVPFQIVLGLAAGAFDFFHSSIFIIIEGMAETLLGAAAAFAYPRIARLMRNSRLRRTTF